MLIEKGRQCYKNTLVKYLPSLILKFYLEFYYISLYIIEDVIICEENANWKLNNQLEMGNC